MPAFVKSPKDEERWSKAKKAVERSNSKVEADFHDRDWALTNYLFHKMGKSEDDVQKAEAIKKDLLKPPKPTTAIKSPMKMGSTAVKMPKTKKLAGPFSKPSLFFKKEEFKDIKKPSIENLRTFLEAVRAKR